LRDIDIEYEAPKSKIIRRRGLKRVWKGNWLIQVGRSFKMGPWNLKAEIRRI